ncbi:FecR family protein [Mucilaginibacter sp. MD40]|uniref:FecR family protein n=1 Tax=Mucilaginibacter sp. MD40 TaxID=2029590 RepID=UPI0013043530|nr:FecR family protein [Mucilaginibacter sp. MD40]
MEETSNDRKEIYDWYEQLSGDHNADLSADNIKKSRLRVRKRLFNEMGFAQQDPIYKKLYPIIGVAALLAVAIGFVLFSLKETPLNTTALNGIKPVNEKTELTLPNGHLLASNTMKVGRAIAIGNGMFIRKDSTGLLILSGKPGNASIKQISLQTPASSQCRIQLTDGTRIAVNSSSRLVFPIAFDNGDRHVELFGEAFFEVQKTQQHSRFFVKTDHQTITVLGTKFNVSMTGKSSVKTTLMEGSVRITPVDKNFDPVVIKPNQQAFLKNNKLSVSNVDAAAISRWKDGYFVFDGENTTETISRIGAWYGLSVEGTDKISQISFTGKIPQDISLGQLIELLHYSGINLKVSRNAFNKYVLIIQ